MLAWSDVLREIPHLGWGLHRSLHVDLPLVLSAASIVRACNESAIKSIMNGKCLHLSLYHDADIHIVKEDELVPSLPTRLHGFVLIDSLPQTSRDERRKRQGLCASGFLFLLKWKKNTSNTARMRSQSSQSTRCGTGDGRS
jgi:hypothetical protein